MSSSSSRLIKPRMSIKDGIFDLRDSLRCAPEISTAFSAANPPNGSAHNGSARDVPWRDVPWRNLLAYADAARPDFFARTIMTSQHAHIQREYGMTDDNCYLAFKQEKGSSVAEYTLYAWPYYIKITLDGNQVACRFANDCEGISHDGIRRDLKHLIDKIKDAFL